MSWHEWMQIEQNQFVVVLAILAGIVIWQWAHKRGERVGYEDGMRVLYRTIVMNDPDLFKTRKKAENDHDC